MVSAMNSPTDTNPTTSERAIGHIMSIWGKIIGGAAGFAMGGPLGALLGTLAGHAVDRSNAEENAAAAELDDDRQATRQIAFTIAVIALGAKMAKADGTVSRSEVAAFKQVFKIPPKEVKNVARVFDQAEKIAEKAGDSVGECARRLVVQALESHLEKEVSELQSQVEQGNVRLERLSRQFAETVKTFMLDQFEPHPELTAWFKKTFES